MILQHEAAHDTYLFKRWDYLDFFCREPADVEDFLDLCRKFAAGGEAPHPKELRDRREPKALSLEVDVKRSGQRASVVVIQKRRSCAYRFDVETRLLPDFAHGRLVKGVASFNMATGGHPFVEPAMVHQKDSIVLNEIAGTHERESETPGSAATGDLDRIWCLAHLFPFYVVQPGLVDVK